MLILALMVIAVVCVLAGVAVTATGRGGELAWYPYAVINLPAGRPLTPTDIERLRFQRGVWGYRSSHVEEVLDRFARTLAERDARIADLERHVFADQLGDRGRGKDEL
ncbi:MAG: DivIVA domain-containing protein [Streptosporangiaceae bacterium]